ncbi:hypothetical protein OVA29_08570 [Exiguobacterium sp. SL14]|nr:hypothetical protein [Exiguobacterium sp. SL14]MCY1690710.1 hypothetical protein [Exiguobacterium sp. SL14]
MNTINRAQRIGRSLFIKKQKADIELDRVAESVDQTIADIEQTLSRLGFVLGTYALKLIPSSKCFKTKSRR